MSVAAYAYESERCKQIKRGKYSLYFKDDSLVIKFEDKTVSLNPNSFVPYDPNTSTALLPYYDGSLVEYKTLTVAACLFQLANAALLNHDAITEIYSNLSFDSDPIQLLKNVIISGKTIVGIYGDVDEVNLMSYEYYEDHKAELKGDKGDKGDDGIDGIDGINGAKGDKGDKGDTGYNAFEFWQMQEYEDIAEPDSAQESSRLLEYKASIKGETGLTGEDGEDASGWVWDLINTGLTAASFTALQIQVTSLQGASAALGTTSLLDTVTDVVDNFEDFDELTDVPLEGTGVWDKICKWFQSIYNRFKDVGEITTNLLDDIQQPMQLAENFEEISASLR